MGTETLLLMQFADDLGLIMQYDQRSWDAVTQEFMKFQRNTGLLINYEKSVVYRIGSLRNTKCYSARKLIWTNEPFKALGLMLTADKQQLIKLNIDPIIARAEAIMDLWTTRGLSLFGKILIINSLVGSLFTYIFAVLPLIPEHYVKKLNRLFRKFIWNGKRDKITLKILQTLKNDGGAGLTNIKERDKAAKIIWVSKMENSKIASLAHCYKIK